MPFAGGGSFDLRLSNVLVTMPTGPTGAASTVEGLALRIDLPARPEKTGAVWRATVTERWGLPATFIVKSDSQGLLLEGSLPVTKKGSTVADILQSFRLSYDRKSQLSGSVVARGQENVFSGEQGFTGELTASGVLTPDTTPPEARTLTRTSLAPDDMLFPWDPLGLEFAEPVDAAGALSALVLTDDDATPLNAVQSTIPAGEDAKAGVSRALGSFPSWDNLPARVNLDAAGVYSDAVGQKGAAVSASYKLLSLSPAKTAREGFDAKDGGTFALLGAAARLGSVTAEPLCETSACIDLGTFDNALCGVSASGVAGRLTVPAGAKTVAFRLRVLLGETISVPLLKGAIPLSAQLVRPGGTPVTKDIAAPTAENGNAGAGGSAGFVTAWTTISLPLPEGSGEVGIALRAGSRTASTDCDTQAPTPTPVLTRVLVDSIAVE